MLNKKCNKIVIYGSCVTRDPIEFLLTSGDVKLEKYLSKTTVVSQMSKIKEPFPLEIPERADFGARMIQNDIRKDVVSQIESSDFDYLIIDFIDERLPIIDLGGGLYTGSRFFINEYADSLNRENYSSSIVSEAGRERLLIALENFLVKLKSANVTDDKIILHQAWWARRYRLNGKDFDFTKDQLKLCHEQNVILRLMYQKVREIFPRCAVIEVDKNNFVSDSAHKWGADPFHYIPEYNQKFNDILMGIISKSLSGNTKFPVNVSNRVPNNKSYEPSKPQLKEMQNKSLKPDVSFYAGHSDHRNPLHLDHSLLIPYITHTKEYVTKFKDTGVEFDSNGVPFNKFRWGGPYRYSVTIGHHGLSCISRFALNKNLSELQGAINVANWLIDNQAESGSWLVEFDHNWYPGRCDVIKSNWTSAMGQGLCISLLSRIVAQYNAGNIPPEFLKQQEAELMVQVAEKALRPFLVNVSEGGVLTRLFDKYACYEEYPTNPSSFVLNGFIYSLLGLYDLWLLNRNQAAFDLYKDGILFLDNALCLYDLGRGTAYDLTHVTTASFPPNIARPSYHYIHVQLLSVISSIEDGRFDSIVERWNAYYRGWGNKTN